jgi:hypothetical protein
MSHNHTFEDAFRKQIERSKEENRKIYNFYGNYITAPIINRGSEHKLSTSQRPPLEKK